MMKQMALKDVQSSSTHLFMVRVWLEDLGDGKTEWRGKVQHVLSKEVRYFRGWPMLITVLHELIHQLGGVMKDYSKRGSPDA